MYKRVRSASQNIIPDNSERLPKPSNSLKRISQVKPSMTDRSTDSTIQKDFLG